LGWVPWDSCHHTPVTVGPQGARACIEPAGPGARGGRETAASENCLRRQALGSADRPARALYRAPNGLELTGDGGAAAGVRCSDVLGARVLGLGAMGLLPPYARDGGSSRCQRLRRAGGAGRGRREKSPGRARDACGARLWGQPIARPGFFTARLTA